VGQTCGPATDQAGRTQRTSTVNHGHYRGVVHLESRGGPIWRSRGREFKSRQPDQRRLRRRPGQAWFPSSAPIRDHSRPPVPGPHFAPTTPKCAARLGQRGCIWVLIAGCYRWVLVSGNPLQHVQRNRAICHPGQAPGCGQAGGACPRFAAGLIAPPQVRLGVALLQRPFPLRSARS
jgi:hypothetical protein